MYDTILFDLDGTLSASGEGITKSVQYALERMGCPEPDLRKLEVFIGPPLTEQFMAYAGWDEGRARQASRYFRERYETKGIYENRPYPGVSDLLPALRQAGKTLCVASSKPEPFVRKILRRCGLDGCFADMAGGSTYRKKHGARMLYKVLHKVYDFNRRSGFHSLSQAGRTARSRQLASPWSRPQSTKVQLAPCHRPLRRYTARIFP